MVGFYRLVGKGRIIMHNLLILVFAVVFGWVIWTRVSRLIQRRQGSAKRKSSKGPPGKRKDGAHIPPGGAMGSFRR